MRVSPETFKSKILILILGHRPAAPATSDGYSKINASSARATGLRAV